MAQSEAEEIEAEPAAPKPLEVDLAESAADDDDGDDKPGDKPSKKARREAFRQDSLREAREAKAENARLAREIAELRGVVAGQQQAQQRPAPTGDDADEDPEVAGIWQQQQGVLAQVRAAGEAQNQAEVDRLTRQFRKLDNQRHQIIARKTYAAEAQRNRPSQEDMENQQLAAEFPDVFGNPAKLMRAKAELIDMIQAGRPYNIATAREAAAKIRGPEKRVPPAREEDKSKFTSVPSQAGGGGGRQTFTPNRLQLSSARAFTQHLADISDEERVRIWAKQVGKKHGLI